NGEVYRIMFYSQRGFMLSFSGNKLQRFILMQYIERKDKNGKEAYDKDIIKFRFTVENKETIGIGVIKWNTKESAWIVETLKVKGGKSITGYFLLGVIDEFEVIGNIYENPELLKEVR
ncbi:MAG: hypothetical protein J7K95_05340, partial [Thermoplasmata archaeon]|nr:hypothetical protein [Thermoplasmata archaeon]